MQNRQNLCLSTALAAAAIVSASCTDPPTSHGGLILGIRTILPSESTPVLVGGQGETLSGLTALQATVLRVDVVHRTVIDDPSTEQIITVDSQPSTFEFVGDLRDISTRQLV
jgi:hypothetical protein